MGCALNRQWRWQRYGALLRLLRTTKEKAGEANESVGESRVDARAGVGARLPNMA